MSVKLDAARLLTWKAAAARDAGENYTKDAAMAKLFASEAATFCSHAVSVVSIYAVHVKVNSQILLIHREKKCQGLGSGHLASPHLFCHFIRLMIFFNADFSACAFAPRSSALWHGPFFDTLLLSLRLFTRRTQVILLVFIVCARTYTHIAFDCTAPPAHFFRRG